MWEHSQVLVHGSTSLEELGIVKSIGILEQHKY